MSNKRNYYESLNGLRAYACFGIVIMHVLANGNYAMHGLVFDKIIPELKDLVFLFMMISGFSTCCGYYQKMKNMEISMERFYKNRYKKLWPFFALLVIVDTILSPSLSSLYEAFADLTLCFGLLPNAGDGISVIGVGWFLGVVFVYYMIFPFICFLLGTKKRAWISLIISIFFSYIGNIHFCAERTNIIFCLPFFLVGGIIYLYQDSIVKFSKNYKYWIISGIVALMIVYYIWITNITRIAIYATIVIFIIGIENKGIFINPVIKRISEISLEIYLCHMLVFRVLEKMRLVYVIKGSELVSYIICALLTFVGAVLVALAYSSIAGILKKIVNIKVKK